MQSGHRLRGKYTPVHELFVNRASLEATLYHKDQWMLRGRGFQGGSTPNDQTYEAKTRSSQTYQECGTQMSRKDLLISTDGDKVLIVVSTLH